MKKLPLHLELQIHEAQTAAIKALQSGASVESVRIDLGRQLSQISKVCGKRLWHHAVRRLGLKDNDARRMINAAKATDGKAKTRQDRAAAPAAVVKGKRGYWLRAGFKNIAGPFPTNSAAWAHFDAREDQDRSMIVSGAALN